MPEEMSSYQMMMERERKRQEAERTGPAPGPLQEPAFESSWANLPRKMQEDILNHPAGPEAMLFNYLRTLNKQHAQDTGTWRTAFRSLRGSRDRAFAGIEGLGNTARKRADDEYGQDVGGAEQDLTSRGLYSSTLLDSARTRASGKRARRNTEIDESVGAQRAGLEQSYGGLLANMVSQRPNQYTGQANIYANLLQAKSQKAPSAGFPWGAALGAAGTLGAAAISDRRLKRGIVRLGTLPNGLGLYTYRYVWGGPERVGLMADEVERVAPDAVLTTPDGWKMVDYGRLAQA